MSLAVTDVVLRRCESARTSGPTFFRLGRTSLAPLSHALQIKTYVCHGCCHTFQVAFGEYIVDVMSLANKYGVTDEGELVSGQVRCLASG